MSNAASEVAAGLVPDIAAELVAKSAPSELAGSTLVEEIEAAAAERHVPSSQSVPDVAAVEVAEAGAEEEPFVLPSYSLIETDPDDEDDDDLPIAATVETDDNEPDEYEDEDQLRARLANAEKKAKHYEKQALEAKQGQWRKKYKQMYELANVDEIHATSRRAFEKAAINSHNTNFKLLEPLLNSLNKKAETLTSAVTATARAEAQAGFGKPTAGPGIVPLEASAQTEDLMAARKTGQLHKVIGVLLNGNK